MRIRELRPDVVEATATRAELTAVMAAARLALDLLQVDPHAPVEGCDLLAGVLRDYDAAVARMSTSELASSAQWGGSTTHEPVLRFQGDPD